MEFKVKDLLEVIRANRQNHRSEFLEALEGYREKRLELLETRLNDLKKGQNIDLIEIIHMPEPQDHTKDYDRVVKMLEMTVDEIIKLDQSDFGKYVMDDWSWKEAFTTTNMIYSKSK